MKYSLAIGLSLLIFGCTPFSEEKSQFKSGYIAGSPIVVNGNDFSADETFSQEERFFILRDIKLLSIITGVDISIQFDLPHPENADDGEVGERNDKVIIRTNGIGGVYYESDPVAKLHPKGSRVIRVGSDNNHYRSRYIALIVTHEMAHDLKIMHTTDEQSLMSANINIDDFVWSDSDLLECLKVNVCNLGSVKTDGTVLEKPVPHSEPLTIMRQWLNCNMIQDNFKQKE